MKMDFLFKDLNVWTIKNGYYIRSDNQKIDSSWTSDMQDTFNDIYPNSWWIDYRVKVIIELIDKYFIQTIDGGGGIGVLPDRQDIPLIADIGGSNGIITKLLSDKGYEMLLIEPSEQACINASKNGVKNIICSTITDDGFRSDSLKFCLLADVIEHIESDLQFLQNLSDKMSKGAKLIITAPAFMSLWSSKDKYIGHFRRYSLADLENKLKEAGFSILNSSYYFSFLYFPIFVVALLEHAGLLKKHTQSSMQKNRCSFNRKHSASRIIMFVINVLNKIEKFLIKRNKKIPFGSSMILTVEKK